MIVRWALLALTLIFAASASPNEASGIVSSVINGDTFEVQGFGLVKLANINCPEMGTMEGVHAREFAMENLLGAQVFLDIDDRAREKTKGARPCLVYLANRNGTPDLNKNFNKMIARAGFAAIKNDSRSEFDPRRW
jgi:micrococcal nuclease